MDALPTFYWVIPAALAGRRGPNQVPWDGADLKRMGFDVVLSLSDAMLNKSHELVRHRMEHLSLPLPKNAPPLPGDEYNVRCVLPFAVEFVDRKIAEGKTVLVHCSSGKDRTGLFMVSYLVRKRGYAPANALRILSNLNPRLLTADGWRDMTLRIVEAPDESWPPSQTPS